MSKDIDPVTTRRAKSTIASSSGTKAGRTEKMPGDLAAANARIASLEAELDKHRRTVTYKEARGDSTFDRRAHILEVAGKLFAQNGFFKTTIRDIAEEVGILSGSLYHYFNSKEEMVDEILSSHLRMLVAECQEAVADAPPSEALRRLVRTIFRVIAYDWTAPTILKNDHDQLRQLPRFAYIEEVGRELDGLWLRIIDEGKRTGQVRSDVDSSVLYRFIRNSISSWHQPSSKLSLAELAELYNVLIFEGIAGPL